LAALCAPVILIGANLAGAGPAAAPDGKAIVAERCTACHDLTGPAPKTFASVLRRKAPDLFYAGSKFNRAWLAGWLRKPTPIRRAGVMFLHHITTEGNKDILRPDSVKPCAAKLGPAEAQAVADHLMTLTDSAMKTGVVDPGAKFRKSKARRLFTKQYPCIGCHTVTNKRKTLGGVSGPDLRDAGRRLNPDWVYARIGDPQYWDPKTWMPRFALSPKKRRLLTLYVVSMK
jgi:mono/diheme cytochrome c family protein